MSPTTTHQDRQALAAETGSDHASAAVGSPPTDAASPVAGLVETDLVEADLLVEDVSIDGMCGVY
jgi:mycofactocin precursor